MSQKLLKSMVIVTLATSSYLLAESSSNGLYIGLDAAFINIGDDTLDITTYDSNENQKSKKHYRDVTSINYGFKLGYQHFDKNRVEVVINDKKINTDVGDITATTFGINYEWGFTSFSSGNVLPYLLLGVDAGQAKFNNFKLADKTVDTFGVNLGLGIRYNINENVDAKIGYIHNSTAFGNFENDKGDITAINQNKIDFGFTYKF